jgi:hypothetical protein
VTVVYNTIVVNTTEESQPKRKSRKELHEERKRGATFGGQFIQNANDLQKIEPVRSMVPPPSSADSRRRKFYTEELALTICGYLAQGMTLVEACELDRTLPCHETIRQWASENRSGFNLLYTRARDIGMDAMAEELFRIADDGSNDYMQRLTASGKVIHIPDHEHMARSRLRIETRKWYISHIAPKRYGDRVEMAVTYTNEDSLGALLAEALTNDELAALKHKLIEYQRSKERSKQSNGQSAISAPETAVNMLPAGNEIDPLEGV